MKFSTAGVVVPGRKVKPAGYYEFEVLSLEQTRSRSGLLMFVTELAPVAPAAYKGTRTMKEYFVLGKNAWKVTSETNAEDVPYFELEDPDCTNPLTQAKRCGRLLGFARDMGWERAADETVDMQDLIEDIKSGSYRIGARVVVETEQGGQYDGTEKNKIAFFFSPGTHEPAIDAPKGAKGGKPSGGSARTPRQRSRESVEDVD